MYSFTRVAGSLPPSRLQGPNNQFICSPEPESVQTLWTFDVTRECDQSGYYLSVCVSVCLSACLPAYPSSSDALLLIKCSYVLD